MHPNSPPDSIPVLGVNITPFSSYSHAIGCIGAIIQAKGKAFSVAINPEKICRALSDQSLKKILNDADFGICDGVGTALALRILKGKAPPRITGIALFFELIQEAARQGWKVFLLGATPESNQIAGRKLLESNPSLQIVGQADGYSQFHSDTEVVRKINESGADIVFIAMGSPKQEFWIAEHRKTMNAPFCIGVGGTFDIVSGKTRWAPAWCRRTGTEWLYRLIQEPKRWRRQLVLPKFVWAVLMQRIGVGRN
ncbi:acetylglucosaminyldiphosphoundecaprenol acetyl-beta-D-mannosaminyltransferase [Desulfuromonas versatilis]|uniref:Acetylglucosaminyldiphosphoundecaprenol acetyl-beta-D-mannosaminyltransferase n=1 Tax=Desulfuromonas versatilis TaxID=2802975 RepID=A0ABN6E2V2_9BACT|nr:WecB/TagA/CpsF family glycosyltransferase [Desulfuromonas versatilis]BCR06696.1 acetylglucosaminyldiphosphoundecaprenol acetyl-beta-D-mannosaminyltransferase [Desulfuromonas versatilis]